jgi:hypothetical protein
MEDKKTVFMKCQGCGVEKDPNILEISPHHEEDGLCDSPIAPLQRLDCQDYNFHDKFRSVLVCHECFHKLQPDMWIAREHWEDINPVIPFEHLEFLG